MGWCNDPASIMYNKLVNVPFKFSYEKLFRKNNVYDLIAVLNYNTNPIKKNKGSAIFLHIAKNNYANTAGCVAIKKTKLLKILEKITKNSKVQII